MAMTHVGRPTELFGPAGTIRPSLLARSNITGGAGWYNVRRSPTNIKTNPNYSSAQRAASPNSPTGSEREEDSGNKTRPRSMVILGTSRSSANKPKKRSGNLGKGHGKGQGRSKVSSNPDVRQSKPSKLSNTDITKHLSHDQLNRNVSQGHRPLTGGSASNILNDDGLDRPEYERGLSSPDLGQGRKLKQAKNRSVSLDALRQSHDCLRTGVNGTCKCTIKLYRSGSDRKIGRKALSGMIPSMVGQAYQGPCQGSYDQPRSNTISDTDVSNFFRPCATVWKSSQHRTGNHPQGQLRRPKSVDTTLGAEPGATHRRGSGTGSLRASFLRPTSNNDCWPNSDNLGDSNSRAAGQVNKPFSDTLMSNGDCSVNDGLKSTAIKRSISLPGPKPWQKYSAPLTNSGTMINGLSGPKKEMAPPKPRRSLIDYIKPGGDSRNIISNTGPGIVSTTGSISKPLTSTPIRPEAGIISGITPANSNAFKGNETSAPKAEPLHGATIPNTMREQKAASASVSGQPTTSSISAKYPLNYNYKPLYYQMITPCNQWYTPYASSSTTYFAPKTSVLPHGRNPASYGYSSEEDKVKVMALLDRYASSGRSKLGLTREEMTNYLNSTKQQLGLETNKTKKDNENYKKKIESDDLGIEMSNRDENKNETEEKPINGETIQSDQKLIKHDHASEIMNEDKENITPNGKDNVGNYEMKTNFSVNSINKPRSKSEDADSRTPSMVFMDNDINATIPTLSPATSVIRRSTSDTSHAKRKREALNKKQYSTENQTILEEEISPEVVVLTQTTFHVDGAITESPAVRRRMAPCRRRSSVEPFPDDVNNNEENKISTTFGVSREFNEEEVSTRNGTILYSVKIPCYQMWKIQGALDVEADAPTELLQTGIRDGDYNAVCPYLNDAIRHKQLLTTLDTWLHGSYLALFFVIVWLFGFVVCYCVGIVSHWSIGLLFLVAILLISGVAFLIRSSKPKIRDKLQHSLTKANSMLVQNNLLAAITGSRSGILGTTLHFVHFDVSPCQKTVASSMPDKRSEDLLLTEISRDFPCLMDIISDNLNDVCLEPEEVGRKVIARDILVYFAASYLENFLFSTKKCPSDGKPPEARSCAHGNGCLCDHVKKSILATLNCTISDKDLEKLSASKPTLL